MGDLKDRRARKKAQTRDLIRTVAQELFAERGFDAVTIADVADARPTSPSRRCSTTSPPRKNSSSTAGSRG